MRWTDVVDSLTRGRTEDLLQLVEFQRLQGIRQLALTHGEDVWTHTRLAIEASQRLTRDPAVWWATACHDLGKYFSALKWLGIHKGHAQHSAVVADALCDKLGCPPTVTDLAVIAARHHMEVHKAHRLGPIQKIDLLIHLGALRTPGRLSDVLLVCEADAGGRMVYREPPTRPAATLVPILKVLAPNAV